MAALPAGAWRLAAVGSAPAGMHAEERRPATAPATARHGRPWLPLLMVGTVELALVVGAGQWFVIGDGRQRLEDELNRVAGIHTLGDLKDLCAGWRSGTSSSP